ncbi:MAG: thioredoxin family protein [Bdellovibrionales bacterium]|nr:thioredoxin family protein [Bdellovibrionales bacterium]
MNKHSLRYFQILLFITILPFAAFLPAHAVPKVGSPAPMFTAKDSNGRVHKLQDYSGKPVVLEWTNHDCPFVRKHYDTKNMQTLQKRYTEQGVIWLTINSSALGRQGHVTPEEANRLLSEEGSAQTAYLLDDSGEIGRLYDAKTTPHMFVINKDGQLAYAGAIDDNSSSRHSTVEGAVNYVAMALDALLAEKPVATASTQSYGCSVKYAG